MQKYKRIERKNEQEINPIFLTNVRLTDRVDRICVLRTAGQGAVGVNLLKVSFFCKSTGELL